MTIDAKDTTITFDGDPIGGLHRWVLEEGVPEDLTHRPLSGDMCALPDGQADYGRCTLFVYFNDGDPGQAKLRNSLRDRSTHECVVTYSDGSTDTFDAFCLLFPITGSKDGTTPVTTTRCVLRIAGPIS